jgi:hypothetical protein
MQNCIAIDPIDFREGIPLVFGKRRSFARVAQTLTLNELINERIFLSKRVLFLMLPDAEGTRRKLFHQDEPVIEVRVSRPVGDF